MGMRGGGGESGNCQFQLKCRWKQFFLQVSFLADPLYVVYSFLATFLFWTGLTGSGFVHLLENLEF